VRFVSDDCLLSNAFAVHVLMSAPRGYEKLNHRALDCVLLPRAQHWLRCPSFWGGAAQVPDLLFFSSSETNYFPCSGKYTCVGETICPFHSVEKSTLVQAVITPGWIQRFVILSIATLWCAVLYQGCTQLMLFLPKGKPCLGQ